VARGIVVERDEPRFVAEAFPFLEPGGSLPLNDREPATTEFARVAFERFTELITLTKSPSYRVKGYPHRIDRCVGS
jgi:hypothetical protein